MNNSFDSLKKSITLNDRSYDYYSLPTLQNQGFGDVDKLPYCMRILLEGLLRHCGEKGFTEEHVSRLFKKRSAKHNSILFLPYRVLLQDFTGIPVLNDLAALRSAAAKQGIDPQTINPVIRTDLVVDHSLQVDFTACKQAKEMNEEMEFKRNQERYEFLRWSEQAFENLNIVPPGNGIIHQINLEYLAEMVAVDTSNGKQTLVPDCVLGTDSHTTMINGLGVVGWGVGGIEALAAMLGYPIEFSIPTTVGLKLVNQLPEICSPTDLTLTVTSHLREHGVVGKFVEVFGEGVANLRLEDRAMISNMTPESGATMTYFPVDERTIEYFRLTGRSKEKAALVEAFFKAQDLFRSANSAEPDYDELVEIDLSRVEPTLAGPKRPFDLIPVRKMQDAFTTSLKEPVGLHGFGLSEENRKKTFSLYTPSGEAALSHGAVVLAAITSCTNTSNPAVLLGAGLLAKKAVEKGLSVPTYIKTSFTPGSQVVDAYLKKSGLLPYLGKLGFQIGGHACATCIGNSGPLSSDIEETLNQGLLGSAVISGNRNFEGRVHKSIKACYLASPLLVIAYAIAGTVNIDLSTAPLGEGKDGNPIFLADILPNRAEMQEYLNYIDAETYQKIYKEGLSGSDHWKQLSSAEGALFDWDAKSSYLLEPPFVNDFFNTQADIQNARVLGLFEDSITTDHISPAGKISAAGDAGEYLQSLGCNANDLNTYGSRRGDHEVMVRGTFGNPRLRNKLVPGKEGGITLLFPDKQEMSFYEASLKYKKMGIPVILVAGKQYGTGSSRDWAAKGPFLLGVRAVIAESYERIHRSNLVMMGILPLQFIEGSNADTLGIHGSETFSIADIKDIHESGQTIQVQMSDENGNVTKFPVIARLDTPVEFQYYRSGGILPAIFADLQEKE